MSGFPFFARLPHEQRATAGQASVMADTRDPLNDCTGKP